MDLGRFCVVFGLENGVNHKCKSDRLIKNSVDNNLWIVGLLKTQLIITYGSRSY